MEAESRRVRGLIEEVLRRAARSASDAGVRVTYAQHDDFQRIFPRVGSGNERDYRPEQPSLASWRLVPPAVA